MVSQLSLNLPISTARPAPLRCQCGVMIEPKYIGNTKFGRWIPSKICSNCKEAEDAARLKKQAAEQMRLYKKDNAKVARDKVEKWIPLHFRAARIGHLNRVLSQKIIQAPNVFLWGGTGVGKTFSGLALVRYYAVYGRTVARVVFENLLAELRRFGKSEEEILEPFFNADFLVIDDVGLSDKDFAARIFYRIIDTRLEAQRKTLITSNLNLDALCPLVGERTISRLRTYEIIRLIGADRRKLNK